MFEPSEIIETTAESDWAIRSELWISEAAKFGKKPKRRERNSEPLILCGHGISMRIENGVLVIRDGFTHYPQEQGVYRYFRGSRDIPTRILLLDGSGTLSFDVLSWLGEQNVTLARIKWTGEAAIAASGSGYASDPAKVAWQHQLNADHEKRLAYVIDLIRRKLVASLEILTDQLPQTHNCAVAVAYHQKSIERLEQDNFSEINDVRGIEGQCASLYFRAWKGLPIEWKGRRAIPDDWRSYDIRSSMANGMKPQNRCASHPMNAMLNYAYAVKQAQMQIEAIANGYDPTIGIMHHGRRGKPAYVFDLIELERPKVDGIILEFVRERSFTAADFVIRPDGVCRLSPQLARTVAMAAMSH